MPRRAPRETRRFRNCLEDKTNIENEENHDYSSSSTNAMLAMFNTNPNDCFQASIQFMGQLLIAAITKLLICRRVINGAEKVHIFEDFYVQVFDSAGTDCGRKLSRMISSALSILEKSWLHSFNIGIVEKSDDFGASNAKENHGDSGRDEALEVYRFKFVYNKDKRNHFLPQLSFGDFLSTDKLSLRSDHSVNEFKRLFASIEQAVGKLNELDRPNLQLRIKFKLTEDAAPDYLPPGFRDSARGMFICTGGRTFKKLLNTENKTAFHICELNICVDSHQILKRKVEEGEEEEVAVPPAKITRGFTNRTVSRAADALTEMTVGSDRSEEDNYSERSFSLSIQSSIPEGTMKSQSTAFVSATTDSDNNGIEFELVQEGNEFFASSVVVAMLKCNCPCKITKDKDGPFMICKSCRCYRHSCCFAFLRTDLNVQTESCHECSPGDSSYALTTSACLLEMNKQSVQLICIWRRVLLFCVSNLSVSVADLSVFLDSRKRAASSVEMLIELGVVSEVAQSDKKHAVIMNELVEMCQMYGLKENDRNLDKMRRTISPIESQIRI